MQQAHARRSSPAPFDDSVTSSPTLQRLDSTTLLARAPDNDNALPRIDRRYLLVMPTVSFIDEAGAIWVDSSSHRDLCAHTDYLTDLLLCTPARAYAGQPGLVRFEPPEGARFSFVPLPGQSSQLAALREVPGTVRSLYRAVASADVVHSGVVGWPYPLGWIANPLANALGKKLIVAVESPWHLRGADRRKPWRRLLDLDGVRQTLARWSVRNADLALFTQPLYRDALCDDEHHAAHITPAVWIEEDELISDEQAAQLWASKLTLPPRYLFADRLLSSKGVELLLSALRKLDQSGRSVRVDIIGSGAPREAWLRACKEFKDVKLSVLDPVPYGAAFLGLVQGYDAVLVPSDEQLRIVFDANARAVPVIGSDSEGLRAHVSHGSSGWLLPVGDVDALARALLSGASGRQQLRELGMNALARARGLTHRSMHAHRANLIDLLFGASAARQPPAVTGRYRSA